MAQSFSMVYAATDAAFALAGTDAGTYADASGTVFGVSLVFGELGGALQTPQGLFVPDCDRTAFVTKSNLGTCSAKRGGVFHVGTDFYDIVNPPRESPDGGEWVCDLKKRC